MRSIMPPSHPLPGETLGQWRALPASVIDNRKWEQWAASQAEDMPLDWVSKLLATWRDARAVDEASANLRHVQGCATIARASSAGLRPDMGDAELCDEAKKSARDADRRLGIVAKLAPPDCPEGPLLLSLWAEAQGWCEQRSITEFAQQSVGKLIRPMLARIKCERWWRRVLRRLHARMVEATARVLGLVSKAAGLYASDGAVKRRRAQVQRNQRTLESVEAVNDVGQSYTLAELAARGTANKAIRRAELMTRVAGFDLIAVDCGHKAYMVTLTCPSRMHAMRTAHGGGVEHNPKFDGTTPKQAQQHLTKQWGLFRSAAARAGLEFYGLRMTEPNHDATPHWHCLLFFPHVAKRCDRERPSDGANAVGVRLATVSHPIFDQHGRPAYRVAVRLLRRYFLWSCDGEERGARKHRVQFERIDRKRGSAASYVIKYISKNIDGHGVGKDLFGNDAVTASQRVDAWASTWGIRQFQQVGGAPVGVWRELRRLHEEQGDASPGVRMLLDAVNITAAADAIDDAHDLEKRQTAADGWATYTMLQGGTRVLRRELRVKLHKALTGEVGRYGDVIAPKVVGVLAQALYAQPIITRGWGIRGERHGTHAPRLVPLVVESERASWTIVSKGNANAEKAKRAALALGEAVRPWSPVNNCTHDLSSGVVPEDVRLRDRMITWPKRGKIQRFRRRRGLQPVRDEHGTNDSRDDAGSGDAESDFGGAVLPAAGGRPVESAW
jgi:hypothetical protein